MFVVIGDTENMQRLTKQWWQPKNLRSDDIYLTTSNPWFRSFNVFRK